MPDTATAPAQPQDFADEVVAFFINAADLLGVPKSVATIYGVLFASAAPLSFADIEARVKFSKGSVSQGLRVLREVGAIKEADEARLAESPALKVRSVQHYAPDMELRKLVLRFIDQRLQTQLNHGHDRLKRIQAAVPMDDAVAAQVLRDRLHKLSGWHEQTRALLPVAKTFLNLSALSSKLKGKSA